jgi:hypothetical protein
LRIAVAFVIDRADRGSGAAGEAGDGEEQHYENLHGRDGVLCAFEIRE